MCFFSFACACLILFVINRVTDLPTEYPEYHDYLSSLLDENDVITECSCYNYSYEAGDNGETASWNVSPEIHLPVNHFNWQRMYQILVQSKDFLARKVIGLIMY